MVFVKAVVNAGEELVGIQLLIVRADEVQRVSGGERNVIHIGKGHEAAFGKRRPFFSGEDVEGNRVDEIARNDVAGEGEGIAGKTNGAIDGWVGVVGIPAVAGADDFGHVAAAHGQGGDGGS